MIEKCETLKLELIEYLKENKSKISVEKVKEFTIPSCKGVFRAYKIGTAKNFNL